MTTLLALASGTRAPIPFTDERGIDCVRVPLDDEGREYARVELTDYRHITETLGCLAAWYMNPNGRGRRYVTVNIPRVAGHKTGTMTVTRMFVGTDARQCARYATDVTTDIRRCNLKTGIGQSVGRGRYHGETRIREAVQRQQAAKQTQEGTQNVR